MRITLNGDDRDLADASSVTSLLRDLNLDPKKVAVERNRRLLKSEKYDEPLADGDQIEVLTFVGGG